MHVQFRLSQRRQFILTKSLGVKIVQSLIQRSLNNVVEARTLLNQLLRQLALAETGDANLLGKVLVGAVQVRLELGERNLDLNFCQGRVELLDGGLHVR